MNRYCHQLLWVLLSALFVSPLAAQSTLVQTDPVVIPVEDAGLRVTLLQDVDEVDERIGHQDGSGGTVGGAGGDFAQGTWNFQMFGSTTVGDSGKGYITIGHVGFGYYYANDVSINVYLVGGVVDAKLDDDGGVGALEVLFRWHWHKEDNWSIYLDGGAGFEQATTNFPSDSHHNFRLQIGMGMTWKLTDRLYLLGGTRYMHISNANTSPVNEGLDAVQSYLGVMVPF